MINSWMDLALHLISFIVGAFIGTWAAHRVSHRQLVAAIEEHNRTVDDGQ